MYLLLHISIIYVQFLDEWVGFSLVSVMTFTVLKDSATATVMHNATHQILLHSNNIYCMAAPPQGSDHLKVRSVARSGQLGFVCAPFSTHHKD